MSNQIDVRDLRPGQQIRTPRSVLTITAHTSLDSGGWATVHTDAGSFEVKLPYRAQLA